MQFFIRLRVGGKVYFVYIFTFCTFFSHNFICTAYDNDGKVAGEDFRMKVLLYGYTAFSTEVFHFQPGFHRFVRLFHLPAEPVSWAKS